MLAHDWKIIEGTDSREKECRRCCIKIHLIGNLDYSSECEWKRVSSYSPEYGTYSRLRFVSNYSEDCEEELLKGVLES